ncbi:Bifunctional NAD(P)H-hydrate repair enzyme Nnr [Marinomonas spartinae]|uniref:bifunctional ADP-dependent NAD(P)H-hydrate dehydratase/NAD(P)H-hydrate epimerase n=1 Tax=Marinomonas spartinae TaxID=1792290 RepID=UPI000808C00B|nr:bifunctional ADP-dependent NAD(P)H-hydrate dehydratase/NAD(P)H-hydrate epimerase [Marinomonas spartinae]SBS36921.1 Bifunctional NAD(P)H-hydrate repair enzyme Nnr [Marinomonas spartinae]
MGESVGGYPVRALFDVKTIRTIEQQLFGIFDSFEVMAQAANALYKRIFQRWPQVQRFIVVVGGGNNGGDGLLFAGLLQEAGYSVRVLDCALKARQGDAQKAYELALSKGVVCQRFADGVVQYADNEFDNIVVVDALLGIGARLPLSEEVVKSVQWMNDAHACGAHLVAVDIATGVDSDTGCAEQNMVMADLTVSMLQLKLGNVLGKGGIASGELVLESLGSSSMLPEPTAYWLEVERLDYRSPCPRQKDSHKGMFGHVTVIGGDYGFGGAAIMASEAAAKAGAGTVGLLTRGEHLSASLSRNPNVMVLASGMESCEQRLLRNHSTLVIGPGLGRASWGKALFENWLALAVTNECPVVLDADGLFWLAQTEEVLLPSGSVLTPHLGEAGRLLGCPVDDILKDPVAACLTLAKRYSCTVVLKGTTTIVSDEFGSVYVAGRPEPMLAKGGSGDVLSGMLGACLAYYSSSLTASVLAVAWHNHSAGLSARALGEHRAQPCDLLDYIDR